MNARARSLHSIGILLALVAGTVGLAGQNPQAQDEPEPIAVFAPIAENALELVVPENAAGRGVIYHALPGRAVQATFTSTTPIETFKGENRRCHRLRDRRATGRTGSDPVRRR